MTRSFPPTFRSRVLAGAGVLAIVLSGCSGTHYGSPGEKVEITDRAIGQSKELVDAFVMGMGDAYTAVHSDPVSAFTMPVMGKNARATPAGLPGALADLPVTTIGEFAVAAEIAKIARREQSGPGEVTVGRVDVVLASGPVLEAVNADAYLAKIVVEVTRYAVEADVNWVEPIAYEILVTKSGKIDGLIGQGPDERETRG